MDLLAVAERPQGVEGERGVAHPREPVIPVQLAADALGQGGRRGGGHGSGGSVDEELQRQDAALDRVAPRPVVRVELEPALPGIGGPVEANLDLLSRRQRDRLAFDERAGEEARPTGPGLELPRDRRAVE